MTIFITFCLFCLFITDTKMPLETILKYFLILLCIGSYSLYIFADKKNKHEIELAREKTQQTIQQNQNDLVKLLIK